MKKLILLFLLISSSAFAQSYPFVRTTFDDMLFNDARLWAVGLFPANNIFVGKTNGGFDSLGTGTSGFVLKSSGANAKPVWSAITSLVVVPSVIQVDSGGTGATTFSAAQTNLGFVYSLLKADSTTTATSLTNTGLSFAIGANQTWQIDVIIPADSLSTLTGAKFGWSLPSGGTVTGSAKGSKAKDTLDYEYVTATSAGNTYTLFRGSSVYGMYEFHGIITSSSTTGTVNFQYENASAGTAILKKNAYLVGRQLQ